jgi:hypothetical protein
MKRAVGIWQGRGYEVSFELLHGNKIKTVKDNKY